MSSLSSDHLQLWRLRALALIILFRAESFGLSTDGIILLSFKQSILRDPFGVLQGWNDYDQTPCSWTGVTCGTPGSADESLRVTGVSLPDSGLLGTIPATLGMCEHLKNLNLSNNSINGSLPDSLFHAPELQTIDLSNNLISGELPELVGWLRSLQLLNLSDNALYGRLPQDISGLHNLTAISLKNNYFVGPIPGGFDSVRVLDLSSNLINGSLPPDFGGGNLSYVNVSFNRISGEILPEFGRRIPGNATMDLSFNNLTGPIPESDVFSNQEERSYSGNSNLCGKPLKTLCPILSSATLPSSAVQESPPAIAVIPNTIASEPASTEHRRQSRSARLRPATILGIVAADIVGVGILAVSFLYVYQLKKRREAADDLKKVSKSARDFDWASSSSESSSEECSCLQVCACLRNHRPDGCEASFPSETVKFETVADESGRETQATCREQKSGALVTVDGGQMELELETLLRASAYILGASCSGIMYKAVLEDGTTLAVRRVGDSGLERFRDFQNQIRVIAKLVHPNLVRIRGFYWGPDEKLIICDYIPNGSLANARYSKKPGSSPCHHVPFETRLKIAKGVARGLAYIHDKKHVHGNLKPTNILLGPNMDPMIGDLGLHRLLVGPGPDSTGSMQPNNTCPPGGSARHFGSKRSHDGSAASPSPSPSPSLIGGVSPYHAPESLRALKPSPKWDVFSFGVVLIELLTGKVVATSDEAAGSALGGMSTSSDEERGRVVRMADVAIRGEVEGNEEAFLGLMRLGYACISPVPQRRPTMREAVQALEKFTSGTVSSLG